MQLFPKMSSSDAMFEASSVYFQYVNEPAAHVKIDLVSRRCRPVEGFRRLGFYE